MLGETLPKRQLIHAQLFPQRAGGADGEPRGVSVVAGRDPFVVRGLIRGLREDIVRVSLAQRAVVKPVIAHPRIDHRIERCGGLQGRMRIDQAHQHRKAVIAGAHGADFAIGLRHVLDQPVDRVVGIGRMIHRRVIQVARQRPGHHIVAFGFVFSAYILGHDDVAGVGELAEAQGQDQRAARTIPAAGEFAGVVGRAIENHGRTRRAFGNDDDGMELHAIAHGNHDVALDVVVGFCRDFEVCGDVAGRRRRCGHGICEAGGADAQQPSGGHRAEEYLDFF